MVVERGIVPKPLGAKIYDAINKVDAAGDVPGAARSRRLSRGREGSDGGRRPRHQPAAFGPQPAGYRRDHATADHARRFPRRLRETERPARRAAGARARKRRTRSCPPIPGVCRRSRSRSGIISRPMPTPSTAQATRMREAYARLNQSPLGAAALGHIELPGRPSASRRTARLRRAGRELARRQPDFPDRRRRGARGAGDLGRADARHLHRRRHHAICPDRAVDRPRPKATRPASSSIMPQKRNPSGLVRLARGSEHADRRSRYLRRDRPQCRGRHERLQGFRQPARNFRT